MSEEPTLPISDGVSTPAPVPPPQPVPPSPPGSIGTVQRRRRSSGQSTTVNEAFLIAYEQTDRISPVRELIRYAQQVGQVIEIGYRDDDSGLSGALVTSDAMKLFEFEKGKQLTNGMFQANIKGFTKHGAKILEDPAELATSNRKDITDNIIFKENPESIRQTMGIVFADFVEYAKPLVELAKFLGKKIEIHTKHRANWDSNHDDNPIPTPDNNVFQVFFQTSPVANRVRSGNNPSTLFEIPYYGAGAYIGMSSGTSITITAPESDGIEVAEMMGENQLFILVAIPSRQTQLSKIAADVRILEKIIASYLEIVKKMQQDGVTIADIIETKSQEAFAKICMAQDVRRLEDAERSKRSMTSTIAIRNKEIITLYRQLGMTNKLIYHLKTDGDKADRFKNEFLKMKTIPVVTEVKMSEKKLHIITSEIYATDPRTDLVHYIGKFHISIDFGTSTSIILNTEFTTKAYEDTMHSPHVMTNGNPCWGNIGTTIDKLIAEYQVVPLVNVLVEFLSTANIEDTAGQWLHKWPTVDPETKESISPPVDFSVCTMQCAPCSVKENCPVRAYRQDHDMEDEGHVCAENCRSCANYDDCPNDHDYECAEDCSSCDNYDNCDNHEYEDEGDNDE